MADFILGSGSAGRRAILQNAGLDFTIDRPQVDEEAVKRAFFSKGNDANPADLAAILARVKAVEVSARHELPVLGADQILVCDGKIFSKPATLDEARENLIALRGRTHQLVSAIAVAQQEEILWSHVATAEMTMRDFSNEFLGRYLAQVGEKALSSVGCYQVEGPGIQLFERIDAGWFTIIGLPLLPFLQWLRSENIIQA